MKGKIFTAPEVQAILSGNKTMFREAIKVQPTNSEQKLFVTISGNKRRHNRCSWLECDDKLNVKSRSDYFKYPYEVGQMIFVKENFNIFAGQVAYKQSLANAEKYIWKPAQQMKQEHSRLTLQIKEIRVERLKDISEFEAFEKEGMPSGTPIYWFAEEWNKKHKKPEEKFEANPFVWSIQFEVVK
jgi:hypothetical protein